METRNMIIAAAVIGLIISVYFNIHQRSLLSEAENEISNKKNKINDLAKSNTDCQSMLSLNQEKLRANTNSYRSNTLQKPLKYELYDKNINHKSSKPDFYSRNGITTPDAIHLEGAEAEEALKDVRDNKGAFDTIQIYGDLIILVLVVLSLSLVFYFIRKIN